MGLEAVHPYQSAYQTTTTAWTTYQLHSRHLSAEQKDNYMNDNEHTGGSEKS